MKCLYLDAMSLKFVRKGPVNNILALIEIWTNDCFLFVCFIDAYASLGLDELYKEFFG